MDDPQPELGREPLLLLVEHEKRRQPARPLGADEVADLLVAEQVGVDLLDRLEFAPGPFVRHERAGMAALEAVVVADEVEVAHPAVEPEEVERGRADEVDRCLVRPQERPDLGDPVEARALRGVTTTAGLRRIRADGHGPRQRLVVAVPTRIPAPGVLRGRLRLGLRLRPGLRARLRLGLRGPWALAVSPGIVASGRLRLPRAAVVLLAHRPLPVVESISPPAVPAATVLRAPAAPAATPAILRRARWSRRLPGPRRRGPAGPGPGGPPEGHRRRIRWAGIRPESPGLRVVEERGPVHPERVDRLAADIERVVRAVGERLAAERRRDQDRGSGPLEHLSVGVPDVLALGLGLVVLVGRRSGPRTRGSGRLAGSARRAG